MAWKALKEFNKARNISWLIFAHNEFTPQHQKPRRQMAFLNKWCYELAANFTLSIPGFKLLPQPQCTAWDAGSRCWLPWISTVRTQQGSGYPEAVAGKAGLKHTDTVVVGLRSAPEGSNSKFLPRWVPVFRKDFSQTGIIPRASVSTEFCSVLGGSLFFFFSIFFFLGIIYKTWQSTFIFQ